jgi:O-antigen/teichoic acid export membrane protein
LLYGRAFAAAIPAAQWLLPGMLALAIVKTLSSIVAGLGRPEAMTYAILVGLVGTVALDFWLIPRVGIIGAAWASSIAYWASALALFMFYVRHSKVSPRLVIRGLVIEPIVWLRRRWNRKLAMLRSSAG